MGTSHDLAIQPCYLSQWISQQGTLALHTAGLACFGAGQLAAAAVVGN